MRILLGLSVLCCLVSVPVVASQDISKYALCDLQVLYIYDDPGAIDWATIYYLNDEHSCRIDLLTIRPGGEFRLQTNARPDRQLFAHTAYGQLTDSSLIETLYANIFQDRLPDLVLIGNLSDPTAFRPHLDYLLNDLPQTERLFKLNRVFQWPTNSGTADSAVTAVINTEELGEKYRDRIALEVPDLIESPLFGHTQSLRFARYVSVKSDYDGNGTQTGLLTGLGKLRLTSILEAMPGDGPVESALTRKARQFISDFSQAQNSAGRRRVEDLVSGYKALLSLQAQSNSLTALADMRDFTGYLASLVQKAQAAVLDEINLTWTGDIIRRDSPHGPKLKFKASLAVNGPLEVELSYVHFHPYWDTAIVVLDSVSRKVLPHQAFVREYLIDVERDRLESRLPDSLRFTAEIVYSQLHLPVSSAVAVRDMPQLAIRFEPDFHFVAPVAKLEVDQVVASMNWKAVISKPYNYDGTVTLDLETPRGVFAGAYKTTWKLDKGRTSETFRIPFSVSNLFEAGLQRQTIRLLSDGQVVDVDTGFIRIASCEISDKVHVGLFPDTTGLLEDILRMTQVAYQPLTDRALVTADLDAYQVLLFGSGAFRDYPMLNKAKDRLEDYLRKGGSLVILGQPTDWPESILPVSMVPTKERITADAISNRLPQGLIINEAYKVDIDALLGYFERETMLWPAVISPAERVLAAPSGASLLSVSRVGEGQIIYCGLPLVDMIARLNPEAIHLMANLLNY